MIGCIVMAIFAIYIAKLHNKLETALAGNVKLLDGMHEGLIILAE